MMPEKSFVSDVADERSEDISILSSETVELLFGV